MSFISVYDHYIYTDVVGDDSDGAGGPSAQVQFNYPKVTIPYANVAEREQAINDARVVIEAQKIRDRQDFGRHGPSHCEFYIVEQKVVETV